MTGSERADAASTAPSRWGHALAAGLAAGLVFAVIAGVWDHLEGESFPSAKWFVGVPAFTGAAILWYRLTERRRKQRSEQ